MSSAATKNILRELVRELRFVNRTYKPLRESPIYQFITKELRRNQITEEQTCKASTESRHLADTYLTYLKSSRKAAELKQEFHGQGERSVRSTADLVGFKLPHDPK